MRRSKFVLTACAIVALSFSQMSVAHAFTASYTGQVVFLGTTPASVMPGALESNTNTFAFDEAQGVTLASKLPVDIVGAGTYNTFKASKTLSIPAGTRVDSQLVHSDGAKRPNNVHRSGSVTFPSDVLGVIVAPGTLGTSDYLGAPTTTYAGKLNHRGLDKGQDSLTISNDLRTVSFNIQTNSGLDEFRVITADAYKLDTTMSAGNPDPVTAGNNVQYMLTVTNHGFTPVADVHVFDTLPPDTTLYSGSALLGCTGSAPVDCDLGPLAVGESATATLVITTSSTPPDGGTITNTATAGPGTNNTASETTAVDGPVPGESRGFVPPGQSIQIDSPNPATITLPDTGDGAPVIITQGSGTFCNGQPCTGPATTISSFDGYNDPANPIHATLTFNFPNDPAHDGLSLQQAKAALLSTVYKSTDDHPAGVAVPACTTPGIAIPSPCVSGDRDLEEVPNHSGNYVVTIEIVYLSGDPRFGIK